MNTPFTTPSSEGRHKRLAIVTTHPIQYYAPVFRKLSEYTEISIKVFYTWGKSSMDKYDPGFGKKIEWDLPLLEGYEYEFLENTAVKPGSSHFRGIINPNVISAINRYAPDAILIYGWSYSSHLKIIRHFKGKIPLWFRGDSTLIDQQSGLKGLLRKAFLKWVYRHVDKAFYTGSANREYFKKFGLRDHQLVFAPHAVDNNRFAISMKKEAEAIREKAGIGEDDILILFAGKLEAKKNPEFLLEAFLSLGLNSVHLLFAGNGILEEELKARAKQHSNVHFIDFQNQSMMPAIYQSCDLFCLPSKGPGETWGLAVNEAMASRRAVLVSDKVGCAKDLVHEGENGYIFESGSLKNLLSVLKTMCSDKRELSVMGERSAEIIKNWSIEMQAEIFRKELKKI